MAYTLDGASIIYKNGVDGKLWKKNANDALDGVAITSFAAGFPVMSRDGTNMFYKAVSGGTLWKKSVSDALDGVQVTTSIATVPVVSP